MIRELCKWKEVNLIEGEVCLDHVHILVEIPPKLSVSSFMGFLKGKTSIMIYQKYGNMKHEVGANQACLNWMTYGRMFAEGTTRWAGCRRLAKQGICNHEPVVPP